MIFMIFNTHLKTMVIQDKLSAFNSLHTGELFMLLFSSADFFKINFFKKIR